MSQPKVSIRVMSQDGQGRTTVAAMIFEFLREKFPNTMFIDDEPLNLRSDLHRGRVEALRRKELTLIVSTHRVSPEGNFSAEPNDAESHAAFECGDRSPIE